ncbi:hypothetical protein BGZ83_011099 [Gryganskiella cystojenkinii]|nr:hypothetical protein BGZ83_011099 [Gryganskiella cystojenkinii]
MSDCHGSFVSPSRKDDQVQAVSSDANDHNNYHTHLSAEYNARDQRPWSKDDIPVLSNSSAVTVTLVSSDAQEFKVDKVVAERSSLIKNMLEDNSKPNSPISLPNVTAAVLGKVIQYCEYHRNDPVQDTTDPRWCYKISDWDTKFMQEVGHEMVFDIIGAATYLDIKSLVNVGLRTMENLIRGMTPDEIRSMFNIVNDFTPEEEAQIKKENEWAEDI